MENQEPKNATTTRNRKLTNNDRKLKAMNEISKHLTEIDRHIILCSRCSARGTQTLSSG